MHRDIRYETAVNAAIRIVERYGLAPRGADALVIGQLTFLLLDSIHETERRLGVTATEAGDTGQALPVQNA